MLTLEERIRVAISTSYLFRICSLPATIDAKTGRFCPGSGTIWTDWACKMFYSLFTAHTAYKISSLVFGLLFSQNKIPLHQIIIHLTVAAVPVMIVFWYYWIFINYPGIFLGIMEISLTPRDEWGKRSALQEILIVVTVNLVFDSGLLGMGNKPTLVPVKYEGRRWYARLLEHSLQDLIAIYLPHMLLCGVALIGVCYAYDPTLRLLLYAALPGGYQCWQTFTICLVEEMRLVLMCVGVGVPVLQLQVISFDQVNADLEAVITSALDGYHAIFKHLKAAFL